MDNDIISRQAAIKLLKAKLAEIFFKETAEKNIEKWLNELPPVQSEQKTGRWFVEKGRYFPFCSNCSKEVYSRELPNFCPNCGAKMESDNEV